MMRGNVKCPTMLLICLTWLKQSNGKEQRQEMSNIKMEQIHYKSIFLTTPFNNDAVLNETFINGPVIINKVKMVVEVVSALDIPTWR